MTSPPVLISARSTIDAAGRLMWEKKVGSVLVVNKAGGLMGIVTERDILFAVARSFTRERVAVSGIMSRNVKTAYPDESIIDAIDRMRQANVRHLPVMDEKGRPVGMLSIRDLLDIGATLVNVLMQSE